eukprot:325104_1
MKRFKYGNKWNIHDHSVYKPSDLYVKKKYSSFKQEISNYKYINMDDYNDSIVAKLNYFMNTTKVKKMFSDGGDYFEYGIQTNSPITQHHLLAVILYTDYSDLCTDFSSTFRAITHLETLSAIKNRNSRYWWMSKYLRETVEYFGKKAPPSKPPDAYIFGHTVRRGRGAIKTDPVTGNILGKHDSEFSYDYNIMGPFYTGLSKVMPLPQFQIRLCSPTSTSRQITVATRFGGFKGMVVQLNNRICGHNEIRGFECSWISRFKEEAEVLWFGGHHQIQIESVTHIEKEVTYKDFFQTFSVIENILNGGNGNVDVANFTVYDEEQMAQKNHNDIIKKLINIKLSNTMQKKSKLKNILNKLVDINDGIDDYMKNTFLVWVRNKKVISINLHMIATDRNEIVIMFMNDRDDTISHDKPNPGNIFKKELLQIFDSTEQIIIHTRKETVYRSEFNGFTARNWTEPDCEYKLDLLHLLKVINDEKFNQILIKAQLDNPPNYAISAKKQLPNVSWLSNLWKSSSSNLIKEYKKHGYRINFEDRSKNYEHCIKIQC